MKNFGGLLNKMDLHFLSEMAESGLSLILGTQECSLLDITNAYATLVRKGGYEPFKILKSQNNSFHPTKIFSPAACYLTLLSLGASKPFEAFKPAWKTGTSWENRDAWAVVMSPYYITGVWFGQMSGRPHSYLTGIDTALPFALVLSEKIHVGQGLKNLKWEKPWRSKQGGCVPFQG